MTDQEAKVLKRGTKVWCNGFVGSFKKRYSAGVVEVILPGGEVVVSCNEAEIISEYHGTIEIILEKIQTVDLFYQLTTNSYERTLVIADNSVVSTAEIDGYIDFSEVRTLENFIEHLEKEQEEGGARPENDVNAIVDMIRKGARVVVRHTEGIVPFHEAVEMVNGK